MKTTDTLTLITNKLTELATLGRQMADIQTLLHGRLLGAANPKIVDRSSGVSIGALEFAIDNHNVILGVAAKTHTQGSNGGVYNTRLTFSPSPKHGCTCPDWNQRQHACKHVVALAYACDQRMSEQVEDLRTTLKSVRTTIRELGDTLDMAMVLTLDALSK